MALDIDKIPLFNGNNDAIYSNLFTKVKPFIVEKFPQSRKSVIETLLLDSNSEFHKSVLVAFSYFGIIVIFIFCFRH